MKIEVTIYPQRKGNRVGKARITDISDGPLRDFDIVGFTIANDPEKGLFVLMPASIRKRHGSEDNDPYFFLRPRTSEALDRLQNGILDEYERVCEVNKYIKNLSLTEGK